MKHNGRLCLNILMAVVLALALIPAAALPVWASSTGGDTLDVYYIDENGAAQDRKAQVLTSLQGENTASNWNGLDGNHAWLTVVPDVGTAEDMTVDGVDTRNVTIDRRMTAEGVVNLVLCDGATLTVTGGIEIATDATLNIYAGSTAGLIIDGTGTLYAGYTLNKNGDDNYSTTPNTEMNNNAGIGGNGGTVNIYGGIVVATGYDGGAGIGGGTVNIQGGTVTATGGSDAAGIGGGRNGSGGTVEITGGSVVANGGSNGAGIGGGKGGSGGTVKITGGSVVANGGNYAAGIGDGLNGSGGSLEISGNKTTVATMGGTNTNANPPTGANGISGTLTVNGTYYCYSGDVRPDTAPNSPISFSNEQISAEARAKYMIFEPERHNHDGISFLPWSETTTLPQSGDYYLVGNVDLGTSEPTFTPTLNLCLNGNKIYGSVGSDSHLKLYNDNNSGSGQTEPVFTSVNYVEYTADSNGKLTGSVKNLTKANCTVVGMSNTVSDDARNWNGGNYVVVESVDTGMYDKGIIISGSGKVVNLILCDGAELCANRGIEVTGGATLNIYAGSTTETGEANILAKAGTLYATRHNFHPAPTIIFASYGINVDSSSKLNIHGGTVETQGRTGQAGIGGQAGKDGGEVKIYGGTVTATGGRGSSAKPIGAGAGIGGGGTVNSNSTTTTGNGGNVFIYGGTVTATGGCGIEAVGPGGAGIGGGAGATYKVNDNAANGLIGGNGGTVKIYGGTINATGLNGGAGIGGGAGGMGSGLSPDIHSGDGGNGGNGGNVYIYGGSVAATTCDSGGDKNAQDAQYLMKGNNSVERRRNIGFINAPASKRVGIGGGSGGRAGFGGGNDGADGSNGTLLIGKNVEAMVKGEELNGVWTTLAATNITAETSFDPYDSSRANHYFKSHEHVFSYSADGATLTATCADGNYWYEGEPPIVWPDTNATNYITWIKELTLKEGGNPQKWHASMPALAITAPTLTVYGGTGSASADLTSTDAFNASTGRGITNGNIRYVGRGNTSYSESATAPTGAGTYTAKLTIESATAKLDYEIAKADSTSATVTANGRVYDGTGKPLVSVNTSALSGGTMQYALGNDAANAPTDGWSGTVPTATDNGTYYVWYKVAGDGNHSDTTPQCVQVTITLDSYTISYSGLEKSTGAEGNPTSYTMRSGDIKLANPGRNGYNFDGWTGTDVPVKTQTVTIAKGSTGNRSYKAYFSPIAYSISYELNGGTVSTANPASYTVESAAITLNAPTKEYYNFDGWSGTGLTGTAKTVTIANGSTGNRSYTANFSPIAYTIDYDLDGGTNDPANPAEYTIESDTITLNAPTKESCDFDGWTGTDLSDKTKTVTIAKGSTGNRGYKANWTRKTEPDEPDPDEPEAEPKPVDVKTAVEEIISMSSEDLQAEYGDKESIALTLTDKLTNEELTEALEKLEAVTNVKTLDLSQTTGLTEVKLGDNTSIENLKIAGNDSIKTVEAAGNTTLKTVDLTGSKVEEVKVSNSTSLQTLELKGSSVKTVEAEGCTNLKALDLTDCKVETVDASGCEKLETVNVEGSDTLQELDVSDTKITSLNVKDCSKLEIVRANSCGELEEVVLEGCAKLEELDVSQTAVVSLNAQNCTKLKTLKCSSCDIRDLNLEGCESLISADCSDNHLPRFDASKSKFKSLREFKCNNQTLPNVKRMRHFNFRDLLFMRLMNVSTADEPEEPETNTETETDADMSVISKVKDVKAYDESGNEIPVTFDETTGDVTFMQEPATITYNYETGFEDVMMDVTVSTAVEGDDGMGADGSGGGCNLIRNEEVGIRNYLVLALLLLCLMELALLKKSGIKKQ